MSPTPGVATAETIPGDPSHLVPAIAENELAQLGSRGAGQPYLLAIKLRDEPNTLHLWAYLRGANKTFTWADIALLPTPVRALALKTSRTRALEWSLFPSGGVLPGTTTQATLSRLKATPDPAPVIDALDADTGRALAAYLRNPGHGVFFDPTRNHDAWVHPAPPPKQVMASAPAILGALDARFPPNLRGDAAAEASEVDPDEVETFRGKIGDRSFEVPDSTATVKTRGSAQRAFADVVKGNYGYRCAVTGVVSRPFLVASHIVPWSEDQHIRLDPSNGICLSVLVDRAFDAGYLRIDDDHTVRIDWARVGADAELRKLLEPYDRRRLTLPSRGGPSLDHLRRRRAISSPTG